MLIINNRFLSLYDYNFLLVIEKIRKRNSKICGSQILLLASRVILHVRDHIMVELGLSLNCGSTVEKTHASSPSTSGKTHESISLVLES